MYRVGLNTAITLYRKEKKRLNTQPLNNQITLLQQEEYNTNADEQLQWLYDKINHFTEIDKALVLLYLENKRYDEIAETLDFSGKRTCENEPNQERLKENVRMKDLKQLKSNGPNRILISNIQKRTE